MTTGHETVTDSLGWGILAAIGAIVVAFAKKVNPLAGLQWLAEAINGPILQKHFETNVAPRFDSLEAKSDSQGAKIDKVTRVIVHMKDGPEALAAVNQEDEETKRW